MENTNKHKKQLNAFSEDTANKLTEVLDKLTDSCKEYTSVFEKLMETIIFRDRKN